MISTKVGLAFCLLLALGNSFPVEDIDSIKANEGLSVLKLDKDHLKGIKSFEVVGDRVEEGNADEKEDQKKKSLPKTSEDQDPGCGKKKKSLKESDAESEDKKLKKLKKKSSKAEEASNSKVKTQAEKKESEDGAKKLKKKSSDGKESEESSEDSEKASTSEGKGKEKMKKAKKAKL